MFELGLVSISFREHTPRAIIEQMEKTPLRCIEWGSDIHAPCDQPEKIREILRMQQDHGLRCSSYGTYFRVGIHKPEEVKPYIDAAKLLGTDIIRLWCGDRMPEHYSREELEAIYRDGRQLARIAAENDVTFCMECHDWTLTQTQQSAQALMDAVNHPNFAMYWQPNQWITEEENISFAAMAAPYARNIHVFNWKGREKYPLAEAAPIWQKYLKHFTGDHALLLEHMYDDRLETLSQEAKTMERIAMAVSAQR